MNPEFGHFTLTLALALATLQFITGLGAVRGGAAWASTTIAACRVQTLCLAAAFASLTYAFVQHDFSVLYVAQNSNTALPLGYRISAVWGAHEGSMLLWVLILGLWSSAITLSDHRPNDQFLAKMLGTLGGLSVGFLLFVIFTSNPFARQIPATPDGGDLNPLLQDPGLIIHPPMLYMGYVGFAIPFAFAIAVLLSGRLQADWLRWVRPWTMLAWVFLTLGIALGSWWAYYELGWGGWWFWDPVENASFMPWLIGTALIHSLAVSEKRDAFKRWTILLSLTAFSLSLLGTFLVRSGVLTSVHAFATDPTRGVFILVFLAVVVGMSLFLFGIRAPRMLTDNNMGMVSRETFLLANSVILSVACATVLLGTLYPLAVDALGLGKISVGPPYFNKVFVPLMMPLVFLLGLGQFSRWKRDGLTRLYNELRWAAAAALVLGVSAFSLLSKQSHALTLIGIVGAFWIIASSIRGLKQRLKHGKNLRHLPASFVGQCLAHIGFAITILGITFVSEGSLDEHVRMAPGEQASIGDFSVVFENTAKLHGPNYSGTRGAFSLSAGGRAVAQLNAEKRFYSVRKMPMTEAAIDAALLRDVYISLGEPLDGDAWSVRLSYRPFVRGIWLGALLMGIGGLLAISDRRFRRRVKKPAHAEAGLKTS